MRNELRANFERKALRDVFIVWVYLSLDFGPGKRDVIILFQGFGVAVGLKC